MGNVIASTPWDSYEKPIPETKPTFDPNYGFPEGRKKRVMIATEQQLIDAKVPPKFRDYCAHLYLDYLGCKRIHYPVMSKCAAEFHHHAQCEYEDYVLRMKEYERERRLRVRKVAKEGMASA